MARTNHEITWNVPAIFQALGGVPGIQRECEKLDLEAPETMVARMWSQRGNIPAQWLAKLFYVGEKTGLIRDPHDYIVNEDEMF